MSSLACLWLTAARQLSSLSLEKNYNRPQAHSRAFIYCHINYFPSPARKIVVVAESSQCPVPQGTSSVSYNQAFRVRAIIALRPPSYHGNHQSNKAQTSLDHRFHRHRHNSR